MARIAAVQTNSSQDIGDNLARIAKILEQCHDEGCVLAALPECFGFMQRHRQQLLEKAEPFGQGQIQDWLARQSSRLGLYLIAGSVPLVSPDSVRVTNSLLAYDDRGSCIARYDKIFLFDVSLSDRDTYRESDYTLAGDRVAVVDTPAGRVGLSVCYDLRFPELYRALVDRGALILTVPSAFAKSTGRVHWTPLLKARAIENTCYMVAPAQFGTHNRRRTTWGHSMILDPWGKVVDRLDSGWGYVSAEIEPGKQSALRARLPCLDHRRCDLFPVDRARDGL
ncbi:MAG: carbon-nitrogen hydrolase family protein [Gammaproteobacteria bacterium]|nr:carbon-nitrogen hydrolase family protein [Gammaproteobacteria bacterium]MYD76737.1 carbon-nitrogen hydrolase family protein [Gammaproteobacteria bacterium]MYJ52060.1 carbon-nitrogen hydrolase family protein [Gammaproteobacteria bacterium]